MAWFRQLAAKAAAVQVVIVAAVVLHQRFVDEGKQAGGLTAGDGAYPIELEAALKHGKLGQRSVCPGVSSRARSS
ncbi:MAG: hypothetical protein H6656_10260 [Ardenticatenaceae bacterium]|nr:hypothetical protein [Ardenticatenaceae bacterium]